MSEYPSIILTFAAGFLSFFSPCVLPLIPSYLSILGSAAGVNVNSGENDPVIKKRFVLLLTTICFILGFTVVFIIFSIIVSTTFLLMGGIAKYIQIGAGIIVIVLGLNYLFDFLAILNYEKRFNLKNKPKGLIGALLLGMAFGAGWTPCIGPILMGILFLAGQSGSSAIAVLYLLLYSIALGIPFILTAFFFDRYLVPAKWFKNKLPIIKKISAIILILIGILIISGRFSMLNIAVQECQLRYISWAEDKALFFRILADWLKMMNL